ncbi:hypothetical protein BS50DRAFT_619966 [Corynespora cassiicola Philippines]|uniref:SnoaL-like domain-containing protein n=1 Tax=Corynespora cassiicola Philippines TaxID=1448308 RepID=A0A2T2NVE7_CORCC|nr:hypothetical protein BS50DRAFT_619966 [Corynespora cassiicola Philippines]
MSVFTSLKEGAEAFLNAFKTLDPDESVAFRADDCIQIFAPASLNPPPPKSNKEFSQHLENIRSIMDSFPIMAKEVNINEPGRQVVIWAAGSPVFGEKAKGKDSSDEEWAYTGEYIFILDFDESGKKIKRIVEFLDSKNTEILREMMAKARANIGGVAIF